LNFEFFIAKRIISSQPGKKNKTKPLIGTAILAIALGMSVMIISVAVLTGFKKEITDKLVGFSSHIQLVSLNNNASFETDPIPRYSTRHILEGIDGVAHYHAFATKPGIIKVNTDIQGVVLKGIDDDYDWTFLADFLVEGQILEYPDKAGNGVLVSSKLAALLKLELGDKMPTYFIQTPTRGRPFEVTGIYKTGLDEFDLVFVFCDIRHIQSVNDWQTNQVTGIEVFLKNGKELESIADQIQVATNEYIVETGFGIDVQTVKEISSGFFDFLRLNDTNVWVILVLMLLVSGFNMISGLFILIINRTNMIGILKALGAANSSLRRIFLLQAAYIIGLGLIFGNCLGITLCIIQDQFSPITLDPASYFVDAVPINLKIIHLILLNVGALILTLLMLILPTGIISKMSPAKTIKFD